MFVYIIMHYLRGNLSNITFDDFNYTDFNYTDFNGTNYTVDDYNEEIKSWIDWFASWFWY